MTFGEVSVTPELVVESTTGAQHSVFEKGKEGHSPQPSP